MLRWIPPWAALAVLLGASAGHAAGERYVGITLGGLPAQVAQGSVVTAELRFRVRPGWHIWSTPRAPSEPLQLWDRAIATSLEILPADGPIRIRTQEVAWPAVHPLHADFGGESATYPVFKGRFSVQVPLVVPKTVRPGTTPLALAIRYQACDETRCRQPQTKRLDFELEVVEAAAQGVPAIPDDALAEPANAARAAPRLLWLLVSAWIGGLLLNLTPCVLPLIPIKFIGLSSSAGSRRRLIGVSVATSLGVIAFWLVIGVLVGWVAAFTSVNQLFRYPAFSIGVGIVVVGMALAVLSDAGLALPRWLTGIDFKPGTIPGSFGLGAMAAVLSTPCTAPFMGGAIAIAVAQGPFAALGIFAAIGVGMSLPYTVLALFPSLAGRLSGSGALANLSKQVLALLMLASGIYFLGVGIGGTLAVPGEPPTRGYWWAVFAAASGAGVWLFVGVRRIPLAAGVRRAATAAALGIVAVSLYAGVQLTASEQGPRALWIDYTPERFDRAREQGKLVVLDFTAEWCLNCLVLEQSVLYTPSVSARLEEGEFSPMRVDLTSAESPGWSLIGRQGSDMVPWLVVLGPQGEQVFADDWYTASLLLTALDRASQTVR